MLLTTEQVAEKLNVHRSTVLKLTHDGKLTPVVKPKPGTRTTFRYETSVVNEFRKTFVPKSDRRRGRSNGANGLAPIVPPSSAPRGLLSEVLLRLDALEHGQQTILTTLRELVQLWS